MLKLIQRLAIPVAIGLVVLIVVAFGGWYFYLRGKEAVISTTSSGRGLGVAVTSSFPGGSAYSNITKAIGGIFGVSNTVSTSTNKRVQAPRLWEVGTAPTAGITWLQIGTSTIARFIDTASGNIFDADPSATTITRRTNTLVPKIAEARWVGTNGVIARFSGSQGIESFSASIMVATSTNNLTASAAESLTASGPGSLVGIMLLRGIASIATNQPQSSTNMFYLTPYQGGIAGMLGSATGANAKRIWTSPITGWNSEWVGDHILLSQKAAGGVVGNAYSLSQSGSMKPLISNEFGLSVRQSSKTGAILYSTVQSNNAVKLTVQNADRSSIDLPFATFADKCLWSTQDSATVYCAVPHALPSNTTLPDAWYRGEIHFSDSWWKFNTKTGAVEEVYDPTKSSQSLDILDPVMSADGMYISFIEAHSGTAWVLRINP